jgi:hypothetical protein
MSDDLSRLPAAIALAQRSVRVMRQNVIASLIVKGAVVALVPFGLVTLWMAVAADMGMSLLVTLNGLRLLRLKFMSAGLADAQATPSFAPASCACCAPATPSETDDARAGISPDGAAQPR